MTALCAYWLWHLTVRNSDKVEKQCKAALMKQYQCVMADNKAKQENKIEVRTILMLYKHNTVLVHVRRNYSWNFIKDYR